MALNYKKELEGASKSMILVHEPDVLMQMIVRMFVQRVNVKHAGILLFDKDRNSYILTVSRGAVGLKIPKGFARMDTDNPLITFFRERLDQKIFHDGAVIYEEAKKIVRKGTLPLSQRKILEKTIYQMEIFEAEACIPSYFREDLLGLLLLGAKKNGKRFAKDELDFFSALASDVAMAIRNAQLFRDLESELERRKRLFIHTTVALTAAIDAKDHYTHGHTARVTELSLAVANKLGEKDKKEFDQKFLDRLHIAGLLHDIGKIGIPESILNKNGPLDEIETRHIQQHPLVGVAILNPIKELEDSILGVKYHHEKYDGSGYPDGLKGDKIPLIASIIAVADSYDAMTTDRPYRKGLSKEQAVKEIEKYSGKQFNPQVANALVELFRENKI